MRTDHRYYTIDNGQKIKVPNPHAKNVALHEFSNIIKKAGLKQKEFYKERERTRVWKSEGHAAYGDQTVANCPLNSENALFA